MRFIILIKADRDSEAGVLPSEKLLTEMGKFNEELAKAGAGRRLLAVAGEVEGRGDRVGDALPESHARR